jgi:hypothetical protein
MAFFLQDIIRQAVVTPLAYLWWVIKLTYAIIPQLFQWIFLLAVLILIVTTGLLKWFSMGQAYELPSRPARGPVEILAGWVSKSRNGNYYKWKIANRLGELWREMSGQFKNQGLSTRTEPPDALASHPPEAVQRYLKAGLEESFVDYPLPALPYVRKQATPFDLNVEEAVEFLESQMEAHSGQKHP